ncbi:MAG: 16S rRNA (cytidine(1402)-2'-O)-methyltransferase [Deltaproteobacteria bacterium]|nr:16S rRNA (cytidine(1402)-2'-O)-methyltransferase [Deltaproteobacteria bacterium]
MPGTLHLVSTPIGNPEDITLRAIRILKEVDAVLSEDTRKTGLLLAQHNIKKPLVSYFEANEDRRIFHVIERLLSGENMALVTDSGTPLVSDPGYRLVRAAIAQGIAVKTVPGACAALAALTISGLPPDRFVFMGFPPKKGGKRRRFIEDLFSYGCTCIVYLPARDVVKFLNELKENKPDVQIVIVREITKTYEEAIRGCLAEVIEPIKDKPLKGEVVLLIHAIDI